MSAADKRVFPRFACELAVELQSPAGRVHPGVTRNLSRGGICLETVDALAIGDEVVVRVTLVFDQDRTSEPLELPARVVWCTSFGDAHQVGTQFRPMTQDRATYLDMFLRYLAQQTPPPDDGDGEDQDESDPFGA